MEGFNLQDKFHYEETDVGGLKKENLELTDEKRKLEDALEAESAKRAKVESEIKN